MLRVVILLINLIRRFCEENADSFDYKGNSSVLYAVQHKNAKSDLSLR